MCVCVGAGGCVGGILNPLPHGDGQICPTFFCFICYFCNIQPNLTDKCLVLIFRTPFDDKEIKMNPQLFSKLIIRGGWGSKTIFRAGFKKSDFFSFGN